MPPKVEAGECHRNIVLLLFVQRAHQDLLASEEPPASLLADTLGGNQAGMQWGGAVINFFRVKSSPKCNGSSAGVDRRMQEKGGTQLTLAGPAGGEVASRPKLWW